MYEKIPFFSNSNPWLWELNNALEEANSAHNACNADTPVQERLAIDRTLQRAVHRLELRLSSNDYLVNTVKNALKVVRTILMDRFNEAARLSGEQVSLQLPGELETPLSRVISQLPELQAQLVMDALFISDDTARNAALKNIFPPNDMSKASLDWKNYTDTHSFGARLGSNSVSFIISSPVDPPEILKAEYRFGSSRNMDGILEASLPNLLTPISAARLLIGPGIPSKGLGSTARTLMVTTFSELGGAHDYAKKLRDEDALKPSNDTTFLSQTHNIVKQMAAALLMMETNNLYFPDAKLANWLVDAPKDANSLPTLKIADRKSLVSCPPAGKPNANMPLSATQGFYSGEVFGRNTNAEFIHSGILGRNLYIFLTGNSPTPANVQACSEPIFQKKGGWMYAELIQILTKDPAHLRPTMNSVVISLKEIEIKNDPRYEILEAKVQELETLLGQECKSYFEETLAEYAAALVFDLDRTFTTTTQSLDAILVSVKDNIARFARLNTPPITFGGEPLFTHDILMSGLKASISNAVDLETLATGLNDYHDNLSELESNLLTFRELENLHSRCKAQGFGNHDTEMQTFLEEAKQDALRGNYVEAHARLTKISTLPNNPLLRDIRSSIANLSNSEGIEALSLQALLDAAIKVPVELRNTLSVDDDYPEIRELLTAKKIADLARDETLHPLITKLDALNTLTRLDNNQRFFTSLQSAYYTLDTQDEVIDFLQQSLDEAINTASDVKQLQGAISALPTVYIQGTTAKYPAAKPLFSGAMVTSDMYACLEDASNLDDLTDGLKMHQDNISYLEHLEKAQLPQKLKIYIQYLNSQSVSQDDTSMRTYLLSCIDQILDEKDLSGRVPAFVDTTKMLDHLCKEFDKPENLALRQRIATKISNSDDKAAIKAAAIAVPVPKRSMAYQGDPNMQTLLEVLNKDQFGESYRIEV